MTVASCLLIDDEKDFSRSFLAFFQDEQISFDYASTWEDGLALFRVGAHELVVADYNLEGSKLGLRLLAEMKTLHPSSRLILISGWLDEDVRADIEGLGLVDAFLPKRSTLAEELLPEVHDALGRVAAPTDWKEFAGGVLRGRQLVERDLASVDNLLRTRLPKP
jgi:DNA-binding NtrC family response regulator